MQNALTAEAYSVARRQGLRYAAECKGRGESGALPYLEEVAREQSTDLLLGVQEIPLAKIRGTYAQGRQSALAGNFMPLLPESSEFAGKWRQVYRAHINEGLRDPISVFEYLGYYYVREGNKRVSVLCHAGAYSYMASITRLLPPQDSTEEEVRVYYELIGPTRRLPIRHLWFSRHGTYTALLKQAEAAKQQHPEWPATFFEDSFARFRQCYHAQKYTELPLTTGDAFAEYVPIFGFPVGIPERELVMNLKNCEPQFIRGEDAIIVSSPRELERRSPLAALFGRHSQRITAAFVFAGTAETRYMARMQEVGRLAVQRALPQVEVCCYYAKPMAEDAYAVMRHALRDCKPDLLFSTENYMEAAAQRLSLEAKATAVLQCGGSSRQKALSTYYGHTGEPSFLCGLLAGAASETACVGFIPGRTVTGTCPSDAQAFAQGAHTVRPGIRVLGCTLPEQSYAARQEACRSLRARGCDHIWLPLLPDSQAEFKHFPGVFAHLCHLSASGHPDRVLACAAWHWDAFYLPLLAKLSRDSDLQSATAEVPLHFRMGMSSGLLDVHLFTPQAQPWAVRLLAQYRRLLELESVNVLDEGMMVEIVECREE